MNAKRRTHTPVLGHLPDILNKGHAHQKTERARRLEEKRKLKHRLRNRDFEDC